MGDFLNRQKRLKPLPEQIAFCHAMAVGFELDQKPMTHIATYHSKMLTIEQMEWN